MLKRNLSIQKYLCNKFMTRIFTTMIILCMVVTPTVVTNKVAAQASPQRPSNAITQGLSSQLSEPSPQLRQQLEIRTKIIVELRSLFMAQQIPFDPIMLFSKRMSMQRDQSLAKISQMQVDRLLSDKVEGVQMGNELRLPQKVELTGDTVILGLWELPWNTPRYCGQ